MVFIRVRPSGCKDRVWTMFNDTETKQFDKYSELVHYLVTSNAVPTMVIYEFQNYQNKSIDQTNVTVNADDEEWLMLYMHAFELESQVQGMLNDEELVR